MGVVFCRSGTEQFAKVFSLESFRYTVEPWNNINYDLPSLTEPKAVHMVQCLKRRMYSEVGSK